MIDDIALSTTDPMTDETRWARVLARDEASDGAFVYAVASTGVYCRPSCPSRRPARDKVSFFALPGLAEAAGYRACKRCRPADAKARDPRLKAVGRALAAIAASDNGTPTLAALAKIANLSPHYLQRLFTDLVGLSPRRYGEALRLGRLKENLRNGGGVADALYGAGYGSSSRLYEKAPKHLGMTPATYAKGGKGAAIAFATASSPLGRLLVAATDKGVAMVALGDDDRTLENELKREFPLARLMRDRGRLAGHVENVLARLAGKKTSAALPLDVRATAFQGRVWRALQEIPAGETRSYGAIAEMIGRPGAARAVGRACALNPVAVVVPCHRAVGNAGALTGYRWGVERKRKLLATEREAGRKKRA
ncbi:MAG: bifunctional DNA-binding transcriptional regulator/O6-methylguanine-DNA methyltransferase Ada [Rhodospirillales bacterium]|nr:bifunctional DNA-binding transcriptional regulator/O6-methylguanine-DNA methyltransferase Ada [Rhodospirillales bacterium]